MLNKCKISSCILDANCEEDISGILHSSHMDRHLVTLMSLAMAATSMEAIKQSNNNEKQINTELRIVAHVLDND